MECQLGAVCVERGGTPSCECPACSTEFKPVCGSNGVSYGNACKLTAHACQHHDPDLTLLYDGFCSEYNLINDLINNKGSTEWLVSISSIHKRLNIEGDLCRLVFILLEHCSRSVKIENKNITTQLYLIQIPCIVSK